MPEIRTLLLTDLVDSTRLTETLGDGAAAELGAAHDRAARDLLRRWHGREIDKTDGLLVLFDDVADAVGCALDYHRALAALSVPLQARAGIHVGAVTLRANPPEDVAHGAKPVEVEGLAKPVTARIMSLARAGQTLLSAEGRAALGNSAHRVQSHGHWRVKGVAEPLEIFEVGDDGAPFVPPPDGEKVYRVVRQGELWLPRREVPHSLPADRDAFVGRIDALADLARRFERGARLVSVLGIGGTGKTRLATRFGWTWLGDFPGGVWFCDLSAARDLGGIAQVVARTLDVPLGADDPIGQLSLALAGRGPCLVILDNFEQVARHAAESVGQWLDSAPAARFLVTSREVLGLAGEEALALPPLSNAEGNVLFRKRAEAVNAAFRPRDEDDAAVERLVGLLDGLPLAIELAAARARVMSPSLMLARMDQRFKLLASLGGRRDRQATLRAAFDWSWELLEDVERAALAQLSVFEGGLTLEAAEAVLDLSAFGSRSWTVDVVHALVDKSFLHHVRPDRFDLLSSVQAYASEHLASDGSYPGSGKAAVRDAEARHCAWFAALGPRRAVEQACAELPNLVVACRRAVRQGSAPLAVGALQGAWAALSRYGPFSAGVELAEAVYSLDGLDESAGAQAGDIYGQALEAMGQPDLARRQFEKALAHACACGDRACQSVVMTRLASLHASDGLIAQAQSELDNALALAMDAGDADAQCAALNGMANLDIDQGLLDRARDRYEMALSRAHADEGWRCSLLGNLGMVHANAGRLDEAHACLVQSLELARKLGARDREGTQLCNLGMLHVVQGRIDEAILRSEEALRVARLLGHKQVEGIVHCNLGLALVEAGRVSEALTNFEAALRTMRDLGQRRYEGQTLGYLGRALARQGRFDAARACFDEGRVLLTACEDPLSLGILLCDRARCEWRALDPAAARAVLTEAKSIATASGVGPRSELGQAIAQIETLLDGVPTTAAATCS